MEPSRNKYPHQIKYIIGGTKVYKIRKEIVALKMLEQTVKMTRYPTDLRKSILQRNLTIHYFNTKTRFVNL